MATGPQVTKAEISSYEDFTAQAEPLLKSLKERYLKEGVTLSEDEAWRLFCWMQDSTLMLISNIGGPTGAQLVAFAQMNAARVCTDHFLQKRTGVLKPPQVGDLRVDSPFEFEQAIQAGRLARQTPPKATDPSEWQPGGYL